MLQNVVEGGTSCFLDHAGGQVRGDLLPSLIHHLPSHPEHILSATSPTYHYGALQSPIVWIKDWQSETEKTIMLQRLPEARHERRCLD